MSDQTLRTGDSWEGSRSEGPGDSIGPYQLLRRLGEGGFGVVFEAVQEHPVKRRVALKVIKLGMDTEEVIARFEAERQALSLMEHSNISRVLDAGATASGRPYFVMELVEGVPISEYCDRESLDLRARLSLFEQVCLAVQHAHTKGVIHRDLKPGNVLVSTQDGKPCAHVIDFGIAKATSGRLTDHTLRTGLNEVMGTPLYMSPEQAAGSADIDTRTDVYSLGVMLYELLTGSTPVTRDSLRSAVLAEVQRLVCEVEPPRPSSRLADSGDALDHVASHRAASPRQLTKQVRGELDWIVMKALEKDRERRYGTANGLAMDVRRFLDAEPVLAAPPSTSYRLRKLVGRNRGKFAAASLVAASLLFGLGAFAWQARLTQQRAAELEQVSKFQADMLAQVDPSVAGQMLGQDVEAKFATALAKAGIAAPDRRLRATSFAADWSRINATDAARNLIDRTILRPAVAAIEKQFVQQPLVAATLRQSLADRYLAMGLREPALELQRKAHAARLAHLGGDDPRTLESLHHLGLVLLDMDRLAEAEKTMREAAAGDRRVLGDADAETLATIGDLGYVLQAEGKLDEAEPLFREALATSRRALGNDAAATIQAVNNIALLLDEQGKSDLAEPYFREGLAMNLRVHGPDFVDTLTATNNVGFVLYNEGKFAEAEPWYRKALAGRRRVLGEEHADTMQSLNNLGSLLQSQGRLAEAEPLYREALETSRRALGNDSTMTMFAIHNFARILQDQGKDAEALAYCREAFEGRLRLLGPDHNDTLVSELTLGNQLRTMGQLGEAERLLRDAQPRAARVLGADHLVTLVSTQALAAVLNANGHAGEAANLLQAREAVARNAFAGDPRRIGLWLLALGKARTNLAQYPAAEAGLVEAEKILLETRGPTHKDTREAIEALANLYQRWQQQAPSAGHAARLRDWQGKLRDFDEAAAAVPAKAT